MNDQRIAWLARPLVCGTVIVMDGLDTERLTDSDLKSISLRMQAILATREAVGEGRYMNVGIFNRMDWLESFVLHDANPRLADWLELVSDFAEHYRLAGSGGIDVNASTFLAEADRYGIRLNPGVLEAIHS